MPPDGASDEELMDRVQNGDKDAFSALFVTPLPYKELKPKWRIDSTSPFSAARAHHSTAFSALFATPVP